MRVYRVAALSFCVCIACDNPVGPYRPQGQGELVPVGRLIEDEITGGVDRNYSFDVTAGGEYVVLLKSLQGFVGLTVVDPGTHYALATIGSAPGSTALENNASTNVPTHQDGVLLLQAHVFNGDTTAQFQFKIVSVNRAPESASSVFELGDTVVGESIDPYYDTDVFTAHADSGQVASIILQPLAPTGGITAYLEYGSGDEFILVPAAPGEPMLASQPISFLVSQDNRFVIRSTTWQGHLRHRGSYRFWTVVRDTAPEHVAASLPIQTVVTGERVDNPIDVDAFTFQDTAGAELVALVEGPRRTTVAVRSPTDSLMAAMIDQDNDTTLFHHGTQAFQLPTAGTYKLRVESSWDVPSQVADTGVYRIMLFRLNRQPETASGTVALGDTVKGEALNPAGDVDEFTVAATAGTQHTAWFRLTSNAAPQYFGIALNVIDPTTGALLASVATAFAQPFLQTPTFTVPAGGAVRIRVASVPGQTGASAPYEFFVN